MDPNPNPNPRKKRKCGSCNFIYAERISPSTQTSHWKSTIFSNILSTSYIRSPSWLSHCPATAGHVEGEMMTGEVSSLKFSALHLVRASPPKSFFRPGKNDFPPIKCEDFMGGDPDPKKIFLGLGRKMIHKYFDFFSKYLWFFYDDDADCGMKRK